MTGLPPSSPMGKLPPGVKTLKAGRRQVITAIAAQGFCAVESFLQKLEQDRPKVHAKLDRIMTQTCEDQAPRNKQQCRKFKGDHAEGLVEFKADDVRLLWFYAPPPWKGVIVCSHDFLKDDDKTPAGEIEKAQLLRKFFMAEGAKIIKAQKGGGYAS